MAISDRISAMYDHVGDIYDTLELGGEDLTNVDKNIVNIDSSLKNRYKDYLANGTDTLWNNWEKVIGEGTQLSLTPTIKGKMKVDLKGNTQQNGTNGNQLSHGTLTSTSSSDNVSYSDNCIINFNNNVNAPFEINLNQRSLSDVLNIPTGVNTIYMKLVKISGTCTANYQLIIKHIDGTNASGVSRNGSIVSVNVADLNLESDRLQIYFYGTDTSISSGAKFQIVISKDSNCNWEEYTGGQPAPSPSYPFPIQVVSGDNSITICGKNIFDEQFEEGGINNNTGQKETATGFIRTKNYTQIEPNTTYYRTPTIESTRIFFYDKNYNYLSNVYLASYGSTFTTPSNAKYLSFKIYISTYNNDIAIIKGNSGTYTPYVSQTYPISLGNIELCKIGTYQDYIRKSTGKNLLNPVFEKGRLDDGVVGYAEGVSSLTNTNTSITFTTNTSWRGITSDYIEVKNGDYILIRGIVSSGTVHSITIASYDENKNFIANISNAKQDYGWRAFNNPNAKYIRICFMMNTSGTTTITNPQVEFGEEPTDFEPYGKVWYLNKQIGKVVLDGSESGWTKYGEVDYIYSVYIGNAKKPTHNTIVFDGLCSHFTPKCWYKTNEGLYQTKKGIAMSIDYFSFFFGIEDSGITNTLEDFKTWLSTHNTIVYYVLATPTNEEITDSTLLGQLNNLYNANSYEGTTNVSQVNDDLASELDVVALQEM